MSSSLNLLYQCMFDLFGKEDSATHSGWYAAIAAVHGHIVQLDFIRAWYRAL